MLTWSYMKFFAQIILNNLRIFIQFVLLGAKLRMCTSQSLSASPLAHTCLTHTCLPERPIHSAKHKKMLRDMRTNEWANITPRFKDDWEFQDSWIPTFQSTQWKRRYLSAKKPNLPKSNDSSADQTDQEQFGLFQQPIYTGKYFLQTVALSGSNVDMHQTIKQYCACVLSCLAVEGDWDSLKSLNMLCQKNHVFL